MYQKIVYQKYRPLTFQKNWGPFVYKDELYMLYDINPLTILKVNNNNKCIKIMRKYNKNITKIESFFSPGLKFHIRNSTNLIPFENKYLGMGHAVLDYEDKAVINQYLIPSMNKSNYSKEDKKYLSRFFKLYLGFFYILDMEKKQITKMSPFFQLPQRGSKEDLIFFPTTINSIKNDLLISLSYFKLRNIIIMFP